MKARFIGEPISVEFDEPPLYSKKPDCPDRIIQRNETLIVVRVLEEWRDYRRRGRMAQNMRPEHLQRAQQRGSWGIGRYYFRVQMADGRCFEFYYDRAPKDADHRAGNWFLTQELLVD